MPDIPRQQLQYIMTQFGRSVCDEPKRCEALLKDLCPNHKRETNLLVAALREGVVKDLINAPSMLPIESILARNVQKLHDNLGVAEHLAQWAVESWATVLGVKFNSSVVAPVSVPEQSKVVIGQQTAANATSPIDHAATFEQIKQQKILAEQKKNQTAAIIEAQKRWQKIGQHGDLLDFNAPQWAAAIDKETQLMWAINPSQTANFPNPNSKMTWDDAMAWADYVNTQGWCGFNDWRLPTIEELKLLLTITKQSNLYISKDIFNDISDVVYRVWSSSVAGDSSSAWLVGFLSNSNYHYSKSDCNYIRLVRSGLYQPSTTAKSTVATLQKQIINKAKIIIQPNVKPIVMNSFDDWQKIGVNGEKLAEDTPQWAAVVDKKTQLMWAVNLSKAEDFPNPNKRINWYEANNCVKNVNKKGWFVKRGWCGYYDWRLPTIDELKTLLTKTKQPNLFICEKIFNDINSKSYWVWSSTPTHINNSVWIIYFNDGENGNYDKNGNSYVRLVRSC